MAAELQADYTTGKTIYFLLRNSVGQIWNGSSFGAYATASYATYPITAAEQGTASGFYTATMPSSTAGSYSVEAKLQSGGSPAETDLTVGAGNLEWSGTAAGVANATLNTQMTESYAGVSTAPTLAQAQFLIQQMIAGKFAISGTTITVYKLDGTTTAATFTLDSSTTPTTRTRST